MRIDLVILHIDDDPELVSVVRDGFQHLGFYGEFLQAHDLRSAIQIIQSRLRDYLPLDLIIVDMNLPDGTGLEITRSIKTNPVTAPIPVIVLSSETSQKTVAAAYTLGASSYLPKTLAGEDFLKEIHSLYAFWLQSSILTQERPDLFGFAISYKAQTAEFYSELARRFKEDAQVSRLWLSLALNESNLANLLGSFRKSDCYATASRDSIRSLEQYYQTREAALRKAQRLLAHCATTPALDEALGWALALETNFDPQAFALGFGILFPNSPAATLALRQTSATHLSMLAREALSLSQNEQIQKAARELHDKAGAMMTATQSFGFPPLA